MNILRSKPAWGALLGAIVVALAVLAFRDRAGPESVKLRGPTMGTSYSVTIAGTLRDEQRRALAADVEATLARINALMSTYDASSEITRFNRHDGTDWFPVSPETFEVVLAAQSISQLSGGAFDVTIGPLVDLWGFGPSPRAPRAPPAAEIAALLETVGFQRLELRDSPPALRKAVPGLQVDLSAIAKGYAVDQLAELLEQGYGLDNYLVEIGGELRASGTNSANVPWRIAIETPQPGTRRAQTILGLSERAVATSGDYRNFFELDGRRYAHTIDPRSGRPVAYVTASVSVLHPSAMQADGLATALLVMGPAGFEFAQAHGIAALFIERSESGFNERPTAAFRRQHGATGGVS